MFMMNLSLYQQEWYEVNYSYEADPKWGGKLEVTEGQWMEPEKPTARKSDLFMRGEP